jgi:type I restriction enzyme, S subunit
MKSTVRECDYNAYINQHVALARPVKDIYAEYLAWHLVAEHGLTQLKSKQRGITKIGLGLADIKSVQVKMPSISEQKEIVSTINYFMRTEDNVDELSYLKNNIIGLRKSILAKAFI